MEKVSKTRLRLRKARKIVFRILLGLILFLLGSSIILSLPVVQTSIAGYVTDSLNEQYKTDITVQRVSLSLFGGVNFREVMIRDHHKDTLIYAKRLQTNILSFRKLYNGDLLFGDITLDKTVFNLRNYKNEKETNLDVFIGKFDTGTKSTRKFLLKATNVYFQDSRFMLINDNRASPKDLYFSKLNASMHNFMLYGPDITAKINKLSFKDYRGLEVKALSARLTYTKKNILLENLDVSTRFSQMYGNIRMYYKREDFTDFNNKVRFDVNLDSTTIGSNDVRFFYKEIGKGLIFKINSAVKGTLNNLTFKNAEVSNRSTELRGTVNFKNLLGDKTRGQMFLLTGDFAHLSSNYNDLVTLLPGVLGESLPENLKTLGQANLKGKAVISTKSLDADFFMTSAIGNIKSQLAMQNMSDKDNAEYSGNIVMDNFNIGKFLGRRDVGAATLNLDVDGKGFRLKSLNTSLDGKISRFVYNRYNYSNIVVNGELKNPLFKGKLIINDPNLFMDFDGLVDLSKKENVYDFHANIDFANLSKLKFTKDTIAVFKGDIRANVSGNTIDNMSGTVQINETSYQNQKDSYIFDDFTITSTFDPNRERTITVKSPDIIDGKIVGKFKFAELGKMVQNSIGSLYANYKPNKVAKGQYLKFDFSIYSKIVEVFLPGIELSTNTFVRGAINSNDNEFKLNFASPNIKAYGTTLDQVKINVDNKNPLYNAYVEMDTIATPYYKISDFSLINVTMNDTLYVRSEFKGGNTNQDYYNLNLYHTIDKNKNNVVGIRKSELKFKDYLWFLNEKNGEDNKVIFDKKFRNFAFDNIAMTHENQKIDLFGTMKDSTYKDLNLHFEDVDLSKILPSVDSLRVAGNLNGKINFKQDKAVYQPVSDLVVRNLGVNDIRLGDLSVKVEGDNSFRRFRVNSSLDNENVKSFVADGVFTIENKQTVMDLDVEMDRFNLAPFSPLGKNIISNIRGNISGTAKVGGTVSNPDIYGRLFLEKAGFKIPYLNTDYVIKENSVIDLQDNQFTFRNNTLTDTKYKTEGKLNGSIRHKNFQDWTFDLAISSDRFLALDTQDSEDAAYYGTAFIDGKATITGPTSGLFIEVAAKSAKGTQVKIPINNSENSGSSSFMHFLSPSEKANIQKGIAESIKNYNGLELQFDLDITPDAEIEVILDRETGHGMKARGNGTLLLEINTLGKFNMTGDYQVYEGEYNFKYKGLFDKRFAVKKYSSISWEGDPMRARLNLEATYTASANPSILLDNQTVNRKLPVQVGIIITGNLSNPEPDFTIDFPNVNSVLRAEIQNKLQDKDIRQTQALTLLSTGGFMSNEGVGQTAITNNLVETAGGIFDNLFQNQNDKVKVNLSIETAEKTPNYQSDGSIGFTVSSQINERITVNGKLGVPIGGVNESAIVGDVEVQYRVNEDGTMNLRFFNRENDINYLGEGIGYTQGVGVTYEVDFDTFSELVNKFFGPKTIKKEEKKPEEPQENPLPPNMQFVHDRKKAETKVDTTTSGKK